MHRHPSYLAVKESFQIHDTAGLKTVAQLGCTDPATHHEKWGVGGSALHSTGVGFGFFSFLPIFFSLPGLTHLSCCK